MICFSEHTLTFTAALFTVDKTWKQPERPSTEEWLQKTWYIYYRGIVLGH